MNNNYLGSSTPVKREMEKVLQLVRDNYWTIGDTSETDRPSFCTLKIEIDGY
jgi:hypothetical protein